MLLYYTKLSPVGFQIASMGLLSVQHTQHLRRLGLAQAEGLRDGDRYLSPHGDQPPGFRRQNTYENGESHA